MQARPGPRRPPLEQRERRLHVRRRRAVALKIEPERSLRDGREHLQAHVPLAPTRHIAVARFVSQQQIPPPEQHVVVQIDDNTDGWFRFDGVEWERCVFEANKSRLARAPVTGGQLAHEMPPARAQGSVRFIFGAGQIFTK